MKTATKRVFSMVILIVMLIARLGTVNDVTLAATSKTVKNPDADPPAVSAVSRVGPAALDVAFTNLSVGYDSFVWDYGDGTTSTITDVQHSHIYAETGTYTVTLTATNSTETNILVLPNYVYVHETTQETAFYVDGLYGSNATGNGEQLTPWQTIGHALQNVSGPGMRIFVASGLYDQALGEVFPLMMESGVSLDGAGYPGTVIYGLSDTYVIQFSGAVSYESNTVVRGFKVTNGLEGIRVDGSSAGSSPVIADSWITGNRDGIRNVANTNMRVYTTIRNNLIAGNNRHGINDWASSNFAKSQPVIENNQIINNSSIAYYCSTSAAGNDIADCSATFRNNLISGNGGGIHCRTQYAGRCSPQILNNIITNNLRWGFEREQGPNYNTISYPVLKNNIISQNAQGGVLLITYFDDTRKDNATLINNTIVDNHGYGVRLGYPLLVNNIIWGHTDNLDTDISRVSYCDVGDNEYDGINHNLSIDPQFIAPLQNNYHLSTISPVIDAGNNAVSGLPTTDIDGDERIIYGVVDMGADEAYRVLAVEDVYQTSEDMPLDVAAPGVLANDIGSPLTSTLGTTTQHGELALNFDGSLVYTPTLNYYGSDNFTYIVSNGTLTATGSVTLIVTPLNDPPVAMSDIYTTSEDITLSLPMPGILENDNDVDDAVLTSTVSINPVHGVLSLDTDGSFTYTPAQDYAGIDGFTYEISDGALTDTAYVTLTVTAINDPPVANNDIYTILEDNSLDVGGPGVLVNDIDPDAEVLFSSLGIGPSNGVLVFDLDSSFAYTPTLNFAGLDHFTYTVSDGVLTDTGTVTITITPVNDFPLANDDSYSITQNSLESRFSVLDNDQDIDGDTLSIDEAGAPLHGVVINDGVALYYVPEYNFSGYDTFTYTVSDDEDGFDMATVTVMVNAFNQPPINTVPDDQITALNTPLIFSAALDNAISIFDPDAGDNIIQVTITATNGVLSLGSILGLDFGCSDCMGDGVSDVTMTFQGTIGDINAALNGLNFMPIYGYSGVASITLQTNDLGHSGPGEAQTDRDTVLITIYRFVYLPMMLAVQPIW